MNEGIKTEDRRMEEVSVCLYVRHKAVTNLTNLTIS